MKTTESIELTCLAFESCKEKCSLIKAIISHMKEEKMQGIEVRCVDVAQPSVVWRQD